jgi:hypothetical protein
VVFKSDVAMTRVDVQVVDSMSRPITGLQVNDFVLRVDGKVQPVRNFASENMPVDILLLLDVSGSMQPHVRRLADASQRALRVLAPQDRMAVMVFDTRTKVRLPFRQDHDEISSELYRILEAENFNGGTHVTHALLDAAKYIQREGRPEARRAIVILTDDETQDGTAGSKVQRALDEANAVLSFLSVPYAEGYVHGRGPWGGRRGPGGGGGPWGGTTWPGGTWPGGTRWPGGGQRLPGGVIVGGGDPSHPAGTADIAKASGGDVMPVEDASAFEDTLERLRQRYALYFYWPQAPSDPEQRTVIVNLAHSTGARYVNAEVRYRRAYLAKNVNRRTGGLTEVSREADPTDPQSSLPSATPAAAGSPSGEQNSSSPVQVSKRRRVAVNDSSTSGVNTVDADSAGSHTAQPATITPSAPPSTQTSAPPPAKRRGWPRADESTPGETGPAEK